ncbi:MAG TPA: hypothetical protein VLE53_17885 [Gemmatimonadaceae bacterium]|nr:hypothetical protein [Gemmatimonadaceae bacterium]
MLDEHPVLSLFILAIPIACISWTVTHEEVFREPRDWCARQSRTARSAAARKFFYLFTCEYCFSHWVTLAFLVMTRYTLLLDDWRGYVVAGFALVWVANVYTSIFGHLRLNIRHERVEIAADEAKLEEAKREETPRDEARLAGAGRGPVRRTG